MVPGRRLRGLGKIANMARSMSTAQPLPAPVDEDTARQPPRPRVVAQGADWQFTEFICTSGPQDRPFEEQHEWYSVAAVTHGQFSYHTDNGRALLQPGGWLLGNHGRCFQCGHDHSTGDRCLGLRLAPALFDEIARSVSGSLNYRFRLAALPPLPQLLPQLAQMQAWALAGDTAALEEAVPTLVATLLQAAEGQGDATPARKPSARDERRISSALDYMAQHAQDDGLGLDQLAGVAAMSKYHFLRTFQQTVGITPHQYLLNLRLQRAALGLATTQQAVQQVALGAGFGDLSTFNARFRKVFGAAPVSYRQRMASA
jgi:AraC-like DNA-binding protein